MDDLIRYPVAVTAQEAGAIAAALDISAHMLKNLEGSADLHVYQEELRDRFLAVSEEVQVQV